MVVDQLSTELDDDDVDRIFQALADATRRDIVSRTMQDEYSVTELAERYAMSFAAVQKHVAVLERAGLVSKRARGRERVVSADPEAIRRASRLLDAYERLWRQRAQSMESILAEDAEDRRTDR